MTSGASRKPLGPDAALQRLRELSPETRDAVVLDTRGTRLAGSAALAAPAADLLEALADPAVEVMTERGGVFAARSERHALVVVTTRHALGSVLLYDLRRVLDELERT